MQNLIHLIDPRPNLNWIEIYHSKKMFMQREKYHNKKAIVQKREFKSALGAAWWSVNDKILVKIAKAKEFKFILVDRKIIFNSKNFIETLLHIAIKNDNNKLPTYICNFLMVFHTALLFHKLSYFSCSTRNLLMELIIHYHYII